VESLFGPLEQGQSETGFHDAGEDDVDDFQEEDGLSGAHFSTPAEDKMRRKVSVLHTFKLTPIPAIPAAVVWFPIPPCTPRMRRASRLAYAN